MQQVEDGHVTSIKSRKVGEMVPESRVQYYLVLVMIMDERTPTR